jgi:hypothetical protein
LPGGDGYATAERLTEERQYIQHELAHDPHGTPHLIKLRAARNLAAQGRRDGLKTREGDVNTAHGVLDEIMAYTDIRLDVDRRPLIEPSDLTHRPKGELALVAGAEIHFLQVRHWSRDPFWR